MYGFSVLSLSTITLVGILYLIYYLPKYVFVNLIETYYPSVLTHFMTKEKKCCLTIDDVPYNTGDLENILNICDEYNVKVTFFFLCRGGR